MSPVHVPAARILTGLLRLVQVAGHDVRPLHAQHALGPDGSGASVSGSNARVPTPGSAGRRPGAFRRRSPAPVGTSGRLHAHHRRESVHPTLLAARPRTCPELLGQRDRQLLAPQMRAAGWLEVVRPGPADVEPEERGRGRHQVARRAPASSPDFLGLPGVRKVTRSIGDGRRDPQADRVPEAVKERAGCRTVLSAGSVPGPGGDASAFAAMFRCVSIDPLRLPVSRWRTRR